MLKSIRRGFTIVELLIVIVVIGLLAALVLNTFNGVQADARDTERKTDITSLHSQLEVYFAQNAKYPTAANIVDNAVDGWADTNLEGLDLAALVDPSDAIVNAAGGYQYTPAPALCDNATTDCTSYTLSTDLEEDSRGTDDADDDTADFSKDSLQN